MLEQRMLAAPRIVDRPPQRMAVLETVGDPNEVGATAIGVLYAAVAHLGVEAAPLRARWPNASGRPRSDWITRWALPVPDHTPDLGDGIVLETWYGGPTAEIVHEGEFDEGEVETVRRLHRFIRDCGFEIAGPPEEEYVSQPGDARQRTLIRYEIRQQPRL